MGYDVHIIRKENWFDENGDLISLNEWMDLIHQDSDMRLDNFAEANNGDGQILRVESEGLAVWHAYSKDGLNGNMAWFDYWNGTIKVKNPDTEILKKMWEIVKNYLQKFKVMNVKFMIGMETP